MTNSKKCLSDICSIVRGETPVSMSDLSFRDPDSFKSGKLRTCIDLWKDILEGYDQAENVDRKGCKYQGIYEAVSGVLYGR